MDYKLRVTITTGIFRNKYIADDLPLTPLFAFFIQQHLDKGQLVINGLAPLTPHLGHLYLRADHLDDEFYSWLHYHKNNLLHWHIVSLLRPEPKNFLDNLFSFGKKAMPKLPRYSVDIPPNKYDIAFVSENDISGTLINKSTCVYGSIYFRSGKCVAGYFNELQLELLTLLSPKVTKMFIKPVFDRDNQRNVLYMEVMFNDIELIGRSIISVDKLKSLSEDYIPLSLNLTTDTTNTMPVYLLNGEKHYLRLL